VERSAELIGLVLASTDRQDLESVSLSHPRCHCIQAARCCIQRLDRLRRGLGRRAQVQRPIHVITLYRPNRMTPVRSLRVDT
jgi:hypothetical protein